MSAGWKEAISGEHVELVLTSAPELPGQLDSQVSDAQGRVVGNPNGELAKVVEVDSPETDSLSSSHNSEIEDCVSPSKLLKMLGSDFDFPEDDFDDDLDPALMEELDREVEEFARRLNSVWPERVHGIIPFGQNRSIASVSRN
uniref:SKP1-like protein 21 isoform X1 n=1 Tax=Tanacetum cinerariifolium TaxID=118510 RepID=A0A6L2NAF5_TANCI|nr:SKP1-like protein 21 isoform X1 [Tanacetum cinerariifolium]